MRVNKNELARRIKITLSWIGNGRCDVEKSVDTILHHFAHLHGIGVTVYETISITTYTFMKNPYNICAYDGEMKGTSYIAQIHIDTESYRYMTADTMRAMMKSIEDRFLLPHHWEDYLEEKPKDLTELVYTCVELDRLADRFGLVMSVVDEFKFDGEKYRQYRFSNGEDSHFTSLPEKITRGELFELYRNLEYLRK